MTRHGPCITFPEQDGQAVPVHAVPGTVSAQTIVPDVTPAPHSIMTV
ncbi:TPA: hypothetical protein ACOEP6_004816 [Enterobacter ludwigii]